MRQTNISPALADQVLDIARAAGEAIMQIYAELQQKGALASEVGVAHKDDGSPLTRADLAAHRIIAARLAALTPEVPVVSEEDSLSMRHRLPSGEFWLIDPLDGTKEFLAQNGQFTVNIALVRDGRSVFGVVLAPALLEAYWGGDGLGAMRKKEGRTEPIRVARPRGNGWRPRVLASKSHMNAETVAFIERLGAHELVQAGSSLKFCRLAEGAADLYPRLGPTCEWDTAAAQAIVEAAGGHVTRLDGAPLRYGKPEVLNPHFVAASAPLPDMLRQA
jgi:3'(2'), 5'-bisphosphate nucleotidase